MPETDEPVTLPDPLTLDILPAKETAKPDAEQPFAFADYLKIDLTEDERRVLAKELLTQIDDILEQRAPLEAQINSYRNQYRQVVATSNHPFPGAFQLNVPVTTKQLDTALAETTEVFDAVDPKWTMQGPPNPTLKAAIDLQQQTLDAYEDLVDGAFVSSPTFFDAWLLGTGWEARVMQHHVEHILEQRTWRTLNEFIADFPDHWQETEYADLVAKLQQGETVTRALERTVDTIQAPISEHVTWEDAIVPLHTEGLRGMRTTSLAARRVWMRWSDIAQHEEEGDYLDGVAETLQHKAVTLGDTGFKTTGDFNPDYQREDIETFECTYFMYVTTARGKRLVRCLINVASEHMLMLRCIRYPYAHHQPYLIPYYIQATQPGIYQVGLGEKLQQINLSINALLAHILNAGLLATSLSFKVRSNTDAMRAMFEKQWYPGSVTELTNLDDVQTWNFSIPQLDGMVRMFALLMSFADDVTGVTANLGGDVDPSDPNAPGNKTALLLRRASKKLRRYITTLKKSVNVSGGQAMRLIAQFIPAQRIAAVLGADVQEVRAALRVTLPTVAHAAAFDVDRFQQDKDGNEWFLLLMKDPLIAQNPQKRLKLYQLRAENQTTGWRAKLDDLLTEQEVAPTPPPPPTPGGNGKAEQMLSGLREKAVAAGKTPEEADQIAQLAMARMVGAAGGNGGPPAPTPMVEGMP